jgi:hypothetical protein
MNKDDNKEGYIWGERESLIQNLLVINSFPNLVNNWRAKGIGT